MCLTCFGALFLFFFGVEDVCLILFLILIFILALILLLALPLLPFGHAIRDLVTCYGLERKGIFVSYLESRVYVNMFFRALLPYRPVFHHPRREFLPVAESQRS